MHRLWVAFFGLAARRAAMDYLRFTLLIQFVLLAVGWTIDLAEEFPALRLDADQKDVPLIQIMVPYLAYRAADILVRLMPVACFFGVFLAEITRRIRLDTIILFAAGISPFRMLGPLITYGIVVGGVLYALESYGRPAAIKAQIEMGQGSYARRFKQTWLEKHDWFLYGGLAVRGITYRGDPPALRDALIFEGVQDTTLKQVLSAGRIDPAGETGKWHLSDVVRWDVSDGQRTGVAIPDMEVALPLIAEELSYRNMGGFYLDNQALAALRQAHPGAEVRTWAEVATWRRNTIWLVPFVLAVLAAGLARKGFSGRQGNIPQMIGLGVFGYICVVSLKVLFAMGEFGGLTPAMAVLAPLIAILVVASFLMIRES